MDSPPHRSTAEALILLAALLAMPAAALAVLLLVVAEVNHSRLFGVGVLGFVGAASLASRSDGRVRVRLAWVLLGLSAVALAGSWWQSPDGRPTAGAPFQSLHLDAGGEPLQDPPHRRWSPANLVAEVDQLSMGATLIPFLDRHIDRGQARRVRGLFQGIYRELRSGAPALVHAGSQLGPAYRDLAGSEFPGGHGYVYIPERTGAGTDLTAGPRPVWLFLHGSLGNFKGYVWVLRALADRHGVALVAPSFGAGDWDRQGGVETVRRWLEFCARHPDLDADRVVLAGLSNGGRGVTRAWAAMPGRFLGVVLVSPVLEAGVVEEAFEPLQPRPAVPVLVIHGTTDRRIPEHQVAAAVERLRALGLDCTFVRYPGEDHFLFFSRREEVLERIDDWLVDGRGRLFELEQR